MTHQPAISFSIAFHFPLNRAGGRTSNVREEMKSYRSTGRLISTARSIPQRESSVIRIGGFRTLRDLRRLRFVSSGSSVIWADDSSLISGSDDFRLLDRRRSDSQGSFIRPASSRQNQMARTRRGIRRAISSQFLLSHFLNRARGCTSDVRAKMKSFRFTVSNQISYITLREQDVASDGP